MKIVLKEVCPLFGLKKILRTGEVIEQKEFDVVVMSPKHVRIGNHMFIIPSDKDAANIRAAILDAVPELEFELRE